MIEHCVKQCTELASEKYQDDQGNCKVGEKDMAARRSDPGVMLCGEETPRIRRQALTDRLIIGLSPCYDNRVEAETESPRSAEPILFSMESGLATDYPPDS